MKFDRKKKHAEISNRVPRTFLYARVSTQEQSVSLESQESMLLERAKLIPNAEIVGVYKESESAAKIRWRDRPVFRDLLSQLLPGDILIVWRLDRLERSMFGMVEALAELNKREIRLIVLQHGGAELDLNSMSGKILALFLAGMAEMENNQRRESTRNGLMWRKDNGYAYSRCPPGFKYVTQPLRPGQNKPLKLVVPIDVDTLEEIVHRVDAGESPIIIARSLTARGLSYRGRPWAKIRTNGTVEANSVKYAYRAWKNNPLRATRAMQASSSPDASSGPGEPSPSSSCQPDRQEQ
jgi:DNA invertase Pin-like site-specific DNA recombinase